MIYIAAFKTRESTPTGQAVYAVDFDTVSRQAGKGMFPVAAIEQFAAGDDSWANVLDENADLIVLNDRGEIDIDRVAYQQKIDAAIAARKAAVADDSEWDDKGAYDYN